MKKIGIVLSVLTLLAFPLTPTTPTYAAEKNDVFVFYSPSQEESVEQARKLLELLPDTIKSQDLNIDPFSLGGESARKKVTRQVRNSDYVVLVNENPVKVFSGQTFQNNVIVMYSTSRSFNVGNKSLLNVVPAGTSVGDQLTVESINSLDQLQESNSASSAEVLEISEGGNLSVPSAVAELLKSRLNK
jgi:hypothetical protein